VKRSARRGVIRQRKRYYERRSKVRKGIEPKSAWLEGWNARRRVDGEEKEGLAKGSTLYTHYLY
jgi:MarR-like DNA-binding transcriptional regulator SgrR of sgrS sRNA